METKKKRVVCIYEVFLINRMEKIKQEDLFTFFFFYTICNHFLLRSNKGEKKKSAIDYQPILLKNNEPNTSVPNQQNVTQARSVMWEIFLPAYDTLH